MRTSLPITALLIQYASLVTSTAPAAILGPAYPAPTDLTSNLSRVPAAWSNFTAIIETYIRENQAVEGLVPNLGSYSFSIGAFSIHDTAATGVLQYYHTGPDVDKPVDGDSVFRVESISKVFTVYLALIEIGSTYPIYTNGGFDLIALAIENVTGQKFEDLYQKDIYPGGNSSGVGASFEVNNSNVAASGGVFSSTNDLAKFGLSILNSTFISEVETRRWLKPISHTNSLQFSVGRPWEIFPIPQPVTGRTTELYAKAGDGTSYSSYLILSPDFGVGFSILIAGNLSTVLARNVLVDALTSALIPALEAEAAAQASRRYAGTYTSSTSLNSSLTLAVDPSYGAACSAIDELSLFPTDLQSSAQGARQIVFRATFGVSSFKRDVGLFLDQATTNAVWEQMGSLSYGGIDVDSFIFSVDAKADAVAVSPAITRATLRKVTPGS